MTEQPVTALEPARGEATSGAAPSGPAPSVAPDLPPDPDAYDSPRASQARARGLAAPYIAGGEDPGIEQARAQERRFVRLLIVMIVVIVLAGFVLGIAASLLGLDFLVGSS